jgi:hypothetical protein
LTWEEAVDFVLRKTKEAYPLKLAANIFHSLDTLGPTDQMPSRQELEDLYSNHTRPEEVAA